MTAQTAPQLTPRESNPRVMYVDDESALVQLMTRIFERRGYVVEGFTQAEQALEAFRADPARVALVVTDFNMPRMSGFDLAREILSIRADTCIVLVSGHVSEELVESSHRLGIRHVIYKANTMKELCESVLRLLQGQQP